VPCVGLSEPEREPHEVGAALAVEQEDDRDQRAHREQHRFGCQKVDRHQ
jgi:hypothetical protein